MTLNHSVLSGSDGGSLWRLLCSLVRPKTQHLKCLFGADTVYLQQLQQVISNGGGPQLLTQGCVYAYRAASQTDGTFPLGDVNRGRIWNRSFWETVYDFIRLLKIVWVDLYHYSLVVLTNCGHTTAFKHLIKVIFPLGHPRCKWVSFFIRSGGM